jgi:hypothetical protein
VRAGRLGLPGLLVVQVQPALGPHRPARDQQARLLGDDRVGVDDPEVDPGHPARVQIMLFGGDGGGDRQPQPPALVEEGDGADLLGRVGDRAGQPHPQRRSASGDRQPHPLSFEQERSVVEPDGDQGAFAAREPYLLLALTAPVGGLVPGVCVAAQHRPCPGHREFPEAAVAGELAAQLLVVGDRRLVVLPSFPVVIEQPGPEVAGGAEQPVAAVGLVAGGA